jgi:hypothetical protein
VGKPVRKPVDKLPSKKRILEPVAVGEQLRKLDGNQAAVARHFGVTRQAVNKLVGSRADLRDACRDARESMKDEAESSLYKAVKSGESWAVCFFLKTQAKDRGYVERQELEHSGETANRLIIEEEVVSRDRRPPKTEAAPDAAGVPPV